MHVIALNYLFAIERIFIVHDMDIAGSLSMHSYVLPIKCHIIASREVCEYIVRLTIIIFQATVAFEVLAY